MQNSGALVLLCGLVVVVSIHFLSQNDKTTNNHIKKMKNNNMQNENHLISFQFLKNSLVDQIMGHSNQQTNVSETNQVILHRYIFEKLQEIKNQHYGVKNLACAYIIEEYSEYTISKYLKAEVHKLVNPILQKLSNSTNMDFKITKIKHVTKKIAKNGGACIYLMELFIYDKANFFEKKIVVEIHYDYIHSQYHINLLNYANNDYLCNEIYKSRDTLTDRIHGVHTNDVLNNTFKEKSKKHSCNKFHIPGKNNTNLEYTVLNKVNNYNSLTETSKVHNKTKLPNEMRMLNEAGMKAWPCGDLKHAWDKRGVLHGNPATNTCGAKKKCIGNYDSSYQGTPLDTYNHPSTYQGHQGKLTNSCFF
jgi:hypothetical protein